MSQLPPKVPNIVPQEENVNDDLVERQWLGFSHVAPPTENLNPLWVDEFIEFSATKRDAQRQLACDSSVTYVETNVGKGTSGGGSHFDKFDEEQFMSMLKTGLVSSTSDHNSTNDDEGPKKGGSEAEDKRVEKNEVEEVESCCKEDLFQKQERVAPSINVGVDDQQVIDPKRVKRILANRQSAQRSRVRKLQYISELERNVTTLQSEVSTLTPRVAFLDHQRMILNVDNNALKAKIAALNQDKIFKDAHQEALKREIERLWHVYYQQQQQNGLNKTDDTITTLSPCQQIHQPPPDIKETEADHPFIV